MRLGDYVSVKQIPVGALVKVNEGLYVRVFNNGSTSVGLMKVGPTASNGHGYYHHADVEAEAIAGAPDYVLIPVERGVIKGDMGAPFTAEQLRAALDGDSEMDVGAGHSGSVSGKHRVHHCSSCCRCECHKGVRI